MKVGDLVTIRPAVAPPELYGVGLIVAVTPQARRCLVKWSTMPDREPRSCAMPFLERISESR